MDVLPDPNAPLTPTPTPKLYFGLTFKQIIALIQSLALVMAVLLTAYLFFVYPGGATAVREKLICDEQQPVLQAIQSGQECVIPCAQAYNQPAVNNTFTGFNLTGSATSTT